MHAFKVIIPARPKPAEPTPQTHEGFEWLYVLTGRLRLLVGERDLTLSPGEAAEFDTSLPHWLGSDDGKAVELLVLFGLQGVRAHLRPTPAPDAIRRERARGRPPSEDGGLPRGRQSPAGVSPTPVNAL